MHFYLLAWSLLLSSLYVEKAIAAEQSLVSIRNTLSAYQSAIIDLIFTNNALSIASNSTDLFASSGHHHSGGGSSRKMQHVGPPPFVTYASVLDYKRTKKEALRWGDKTERYPHDTSLNQYIESTFSSSMMSPSGMYTLQTLMQTTSERCLIGQSVADAKVQSATTTTSPLCLGLAHKDRVAVRKALTNTTQEDYVRTSVRSMVDMRNGNDTKVAVNNVIGLFNLMIAVTTDIEVAMLFNKKANGDLHCGSMHTSSRQ